MEQTNKQQNSNQTNNTTNKNTFLFRDPLYPIPKSGLT